VGLAEVAAAPTYVDALPGVCAQAANIGLQTDVSAQVDAVTQADVSAEAFDVTAQADIISVAPPQAVSTPVVINSPQLQLCPCCEALRPMEYFVHPHRSTPSEDVPHVV